MGKRGPGAKPKTTKKHARTKKSGPWPWEDLSLPVAERVILFSEMLPITSGLLAGQQVRLYPQQKDDIRGLFRCDENGKRLVRQGLLSMARKQGKSGLACYLALSALCGPLVEPRGQIYSAASDRNQAAIIFKEMVAIIDQIPWMREQLNIRSFNKIIEDEKSGSVYEALSADARKAHGLSPSLAIADEVAQWRGRDLWDNLVSGMGARAEPLALAIGTQSADNNSLMSELCDYSQQVESGEVVDPSWFGRLYTVPRDADPWDESLWPLANPGLHVTCDINSLRVAAEQAKKLPSREAVFRSLHLNQRTDAAERWISSTVWLKNGDEVPLQELYGKECWCGLDLSSTTDLSCLVAYFPHNGAVLCWFWLPGEQLDEREQSLQVPLRVWRDKGLIELTPGSAVDKAFIAARLRQVADDFLVQGVAFDRWRIEDLKKILDNEGILLPLVPFGQGFKEFSPAIDELEILLHSGKLKHGNNPILMWNVSSACLELDPAGNKKFSKRRQSQKIDGAVALAMSVGLHARQVVKKPFDASQIMAFNF